MLKISLMAAALALLATGATAQTTPASQAPSQPPVADPTADEIASWIGGRHGEVEGVDAQPLQGPQRDGKVHGEFGASVGSGGYKSGYGVATVPIGSRGDVTVGISDEHLGGGNRAYGRGGYGPGGYGSGGDRRTLSIGVDLAGDRQRCDRGDRGIGDPNWGAPSRSSDPACPPGAPASQPAR